MPVQVSYADGGRYLLQSPFQDVLSFLWKGGQWSVSATQDALLTAGNAGSKPTRLGVTLYYNGGAGRYEFAPPQTLQPEQAITIDVGKIVAAQVPDVNGHTIPPDTTMGSYQLSDLDDQAVGYLYEGKLQVDRRNGFVSYGCAICCYWYGPYITNFSGNVGDSGPVSLLATNSCTLNDDDKTSLGMNWASSDPSVATMSAPWVSAVGPGQTYSNASLYLRGVNGSGKCPTYLLAALGRITVQKPTQVVAVGTQEQGAAVCPTGQAGWSRTAIDELRDQTYVTPIKRAGITMRDTINSPQPNELGITSSVTGSHTTDSNGRWPDTYFVCSSVCVSQNGQTNSAQSWTANGASLSWINAVQYTCASITIDGQ